MDNNSHQFRDLTITPISQTEDLVVSCDVSAGFGDRKYDLVKCSPEISVSLTLRTAMLELISYGATPINVIDTLSVEYDPTGLKVIAQMKSDLKEMGYSNVPINGSTEDNLNTEMTTVGITVIGRSPKKVDLTNERSDLAIFQLGVPYMGQAVLDNFSKIFSVKQVIELRKDPLVSDMIPVGSKGVSYELGVLAKTHNLNLELSQQIDDLEIKQTAGPSTVLLVAVENSMKHQFLQKYPDLKWIARLGK
ncbi:hypothetical protein [Companilactobacillus versmoldensis]|uniref:PurM-like N-terminal domain-containing protein n=1 Tax=Companilactobacillus versmoldensis DSM 14857 = KCTC 3814 TaxID=1423815 RepID=A0A0R1SFZ4_9LACO|nr:hypothetical protein [Companilactobacillus versmoldensis]KRL68215.1 hypothetical protein FC27_GL000957 [Companilactobacillus versmoldensis DSM 14857 = KCTC 3814]